MIINPLDMTYQDHLKEAWSHFIVNDDSYDYSFIREEVLSSWSRSRDANVDPHSIIMQRLSPEKMKELCFINKDLIDVAKPYMRHLSSIINDPDSYILLCDKDGFVLDNTGESDAIVGETSVTLLTPGVERSERVAGTNAIGTTIYLRTPLQLCGNEHYIEKHKIYACSCAPIFDKQNNSLIGVINLTILTEKAHRHTLGMMSSAADSISKELVLHRTLCEMELISSQRNTIIENLSSGVLLLDINYRISQANQRIADMLEVSKDILIGSSLFNIISIDEKDDSGSLFEIFKSEHYNDEVSINAFDASRSSKKFRLSLNFIKDEENKTVGYLFRLNELELINTLVKKISGFSAHFTFDNIIGESEIMKSTKLTAYKAAKSTSNILIIGDSGVGKELFAQSIHNAGKMSCGPFVAINCAAIPNNLVESELFGYERGAFTGADKNGRPGKFEMANGGTLFLDEIGDMPLNIQAVLLRVIQTKEVVRIGGKSPIPISVRIIAATNQNLPLMVEEKSFRSDLYYRLNIFTINIPPLTVRGAKDIQTLIEYFIHTHCTASQLRDLSIAPEVYSALESYSWPGNVRQLENVIERMINIADSDEIITLNHLPDEIVRSMNSRHLLSKHEFMHTVTKKNHATTLVEAPHFVSSSPASLNVKENEKNLIISALTQSCGNVNQASIIMSMNLRTLYRKIDKYNLIVDDFR